MLRRAKVIGYCLAFYSKTLFKSIPTNTIPLHTFVSAVLEDDTVVSVSGDVEVDVVVIESDDSICRKFFSTKRMV